MFKHFLLTYYRNAVANKLQTGINYIGLSISVALIVLILLYVNSELTFDRFHTKADYIYRMTTKIITPGGENNLAFSNTAFAYILKKECPEIENIACIDVGGVYHVKYENRVFRESNVRLSTSGIFDLFSYQFLKGNPETQLREPYTTVLTEALAKKLFDNLDPIGKIIAFEDKNYTVTGVIKDLPSNTDLKITALLASPVNGTEELIDWEDYFVYLLVNKNANSSLQKKINEITNKTY
ncbi:MAG TPA: ABC transporter permease, partial [Bacteroidales bacterium]